MSVSVRKENFDSGQLATGGTLTAVVKRLVRHAAGDWTFHVALSGFSSLPDGRSVVVKRQVRVKATQQVGRKPKGRAA